MQVVHPHPHAGIERKAVTFAGAYEKEHSGPDRNGFAAQFVAAGALPEIVQRMVAEAGLRKEPNRILHGEIVGEPQPRGTGLRRGRNRSGNESLPVHVSPSPPVGDGGQ